MPIVFAELPGTGKTDRLYKPWDLVNTAKRSAQRALAKIRRWIDADASKRTIDQR
jgi:hypothetical protein